MSSVVPPLSMASKQTRDALDACLERLHDLGITMSVDLHPSERDIDASIGRKYTNSRVITATCGKKSAKIAVDPAPDKGSDEKNRLFALLMFLSWLVRRANIRGSVIPQFAEWRALREVIGEDNLIDLCQALVDSGLADRMPIFKKLRKPRADVLAEQAEIAAALAHLPERKGYLSLVMTYPEDAGGIEFLSGSVEAILRLCELAALCAPFEPYGETFEVDIRRAQSGTDLTAYSEVGVFAFPRRPQPPQILDVVKKVLAVAASGIQIRRGSLVLHLLVPHEPNPRERLVARGELDAWLGLIGMRVTDVL